MQQQRYEWLQRIKAVEREHTVAELSIARLLQQSQNNPSGLPAALRVRDVRTTSDNLEGTYLIRLFAEFETGLRESWSALRGSDPPSRTRDLLDGIAAYRKIPNDELASAHQVRDYRNRLVHERDESTEPVTILMARRSLCRYLSFLPLGW